ncbi:hypothetical protein JXJ21_12090 [candidate division KSB1 bacterium]|nr:hypothetical protein [candidate division KSB1 bacterium]
MKWLKKLFISLLALLVLAFAALYFFSRGARGIGVNEVIVQINRPASQVYPWLVESVKLKQWIGGFTESVALTEGGLRIGAKSGEIYVTGNDTTDMVSEVINFRKNEFLFLLITSAAFDVDARYMLSESAGTTKLHYFATTQYKPFAARLFEPLATPAAQKKIEHDLNSLKALVEAETVESNSMQQIF